MICRTKGNSQQEWPHGVFRNVAHREQSAVGQVDQEMHALVGPGGDFDFEADFMDLVADPVDLDIELDVELRLDGPLKHCRSIGALDRKVLDILCQRRNLRRVFGRPRAVALVAWILIGH